MLDIDASGYEFEYMLMQGGKQICYHSELFHGYVLNYHTYGKELFIVVQTLKKMKHYLLGKRTMIHVVATKSER